MGRRLPAHLIRLLDNERLDSADLVLLARHLNAVTMGELSWAMAEGLGRIPDPGLRNANAIRKALANARAATPRIPLGRAHELVQQVQQQMGGAELQPVGSIRRFDATVGDLELMAFADDPGPLIDAFLTLAGERVLHQSADKATIAYEQGEITLRIVQLAASGAALVHYTGSARHNATLRRLARTRALRFEPDGLFREDGLRIEAIDERQFFDRLGLPYIAPELRESTGEIDAALAGALPRLVELGDMRGDLHMHSTWSDGRDSISDMVQAAHALGYEYVALTDHSASTVANGLDVRKLRKQRDEVARVRAEHPTITVLHGIEVDILPGGRLDLPDAELAQLDIVLASLHEAAGHSADELMKRYLMAMRHPLVHVITHPINRLVGQHDGYSLDVGALIDAAIQTKTILEIDGGPSHLDMDGTMARRAVEAGALVSIDGDCHRADRLGLQMQFGVGTARRGWVEARHVINTRPLGELRTILNRKRG